MSSLLRCMGELVRRFAAEDAGVVDENVDIGRAPCELSHLARGKVGVSVPGQHVEPGTAAIPLHPRVPSDYEFDGTLGDMTFREIVELHPLPASDVREALLRCAEEC